MHRTRAPRSKPVVSGGNFGGRDRDFNAVCPGTASERQLAEAGVGGDRVTVLQPPAELVEAMGIGADRDGSPTKLAEAGDDRGMRERASDRVAQTAGVDLERRPALDQGMKDRLVQFRGRLEVG